MKYEIIYDEEKNKIKYGNIVLCGWDNSVNLHDTEELIWRKEVRQNEEN